MKKQIQIAINKEDTIIIDLEGDESVTFQFDDPPSGLDACKEQVPSIQINGLRWRNDEHYHLSWLERNISLGDEVVITYGESSKEPSKLIKEEKYIKPEESCSFCNKIKSEVDLLIKGSFYHYICNECVSLCGEIIEKKA